MHGKLWRALWKLIQDELFQAADSELLETGVGVVQMQDRDLLRVFVRRDPFDRFLFLHGLCDPGSLQHALSHQNSADPQSVFQFRSNG